MLDLEIVGETVAARRRELRLTQPEVAKRARVSRSTLAALEGGKAAELGFNKVAMILSTLGLDLKIVDWNRGRPTFDELKEENLRHAKGLGR